MFTNVIDLDQPGGWPADLVSYLNKHCAVLADWERGHGLPTEYDRTIYGLRDILNNYSLIGWHCTRFTEAEIAAIIGDGMGCPMLRCLIEA
jgi:hypothetical protein